MSESRLGFVLGAISLSLAASVAQAATVSRITVAVADTAKGTVTTAQPVPTSIPPVRPPVRPPTRS